MPNMGKALTISWDAQKSGCIANSLNSLQEEFPIRVESDRKDSGNSAPGVAFEGDVLTSISGYELNVSRLTKSIPPVPLQIRNGNVSTLNPGKGANQSLWTFIGLLPMISLTWLNPSNKIRFVMFSQPTMMLFSSYSTTQTAYSSLRRTPLSQCCYKSKSKQPSFTSSFPLCLHLSLRFIATLTTYEAQFSLVLPSYSN